MRSVHFDYPNTCPRIDKVAIELQQLVEQYLTQEDAESIDDEFWKIVDRFRDINSDMRDEADDQIRSLKIDVQNLEFDLEETIKKLEQVEAERDEYKYTYEGLC